jgi:hypothetical protein
VCDHDAGPEGEGLHTVEGAAAAPRGIAVTTTDVPDAEPPDPSLHWNTPGRSGSNGGIDLPTRKLRRIDTIVTVGCQTGEDGQTGRIPVGRTPASARYPAFRRRALHCLLDTGYRPAMSHDIPSVPITFECTPLRSVPRFDVPLDASPAFRRRLARMQRAVACHGTRNTYYLTDGICTFRFTNDTQSGWVQFAFEGTLITDEADRHTVGSDVEVTLERETCDWLTQPAVEWLKRTVKHAVEAEFNRYIAAGDLSRALERQAREQAASDAAGGFLGMNL